MRKTSRMAHGLTALLLLIAAAAANAQAPHRAYSILLGGSSSEGARIAVDGTGQTWLVGGTDSWDFPFTPGPAADTSPGSFIARLSPAGRLSSAIRFGGSHSGVYSIHLDAAGNLYVAGVTGNASTDFPITTRLAPRGEYGSVFVLKLDPEGDLVYSTAIGGTPHLTIADLAVDAEGQAHVVGHTQGAHADARDMFIIKLSADGSRFIYSRELGGSRTDIALGVALDSAGNAHVAGFTYSGDFSQARPLPENGAAELPEAVVVKLSPDGSRLIYSKLLGGGGSDAAQAIAIDRAGNALVYGGTTSTDFPVRNALQPQPNPDTEWLGDAFLARLDPAGALLGSTYLGGSDEDAAMELIVDPAGFIYLLGITASPDFPLRNPLPSSQVPYHQSSGRGYSVGHVTRLDPQASEILFSTFLDGTGLDLGWLNGMALDTAGNIYVTGTTIYDYFPVIGPSQRAVVDTENGDIFVVKIDLGLLRAPDCSAAAATPPTIWPPDGRMVPVAIGGVTDPDGDAVRVAVTAIFQDEPLAKKGQPDATGLGIAEGTAAPRVRASRAGGGDGRVYHLTFTATDSRGASCTGAVTVCVPHDQGKRSACGDGGRLVDSVSGRYPPPPAWTVWLDRDDPSGTGDWETVAEFRAEGNNICNGATPIGIECQTSSGVDWTSAGQVYTCNAATGGVCLNSRQPGGECLDYRVRFLCP